MANILFLKLRNDITLPGDVALAERELNAFFQRVISINKNGEVLKYIDLPEDCIAANTRPGYPMGFVVENPRDNLPEVVMKLNFIQEIWGLNSDDTLSGLEKNPWSCARQIQDKNVVCLVPLLAAAEILSFIKEPSSSATDIREITGVLCGGNLVRHKNIQEAITRKITSTPHVHNLHKYKAKFFPRLIRSFLASKHAAIPETAPGRRILLDPFVGSGTALVEAAFLGYESIGIDIDPLSCSISQAKINMLDILPETINSAVYKVVTEKEFHLDTSRQTGCYHFPPWIAKKFERWNSLNEQIKYEKEITLWLSSINRIEEPTVRQILAVSLSDAISRKFNIRMLGTGSGRFALEIGNASLSSLVKSNFKGLSHQALVVNALKQAYGIELPGSKVIRGSATTMSLPEKSVSVILTSPPYLPASSGRENYLIGKSISITALGLMTADDIKEAEKQSIGSMHSERAFESFEIPGEVQKLHQWLKADPLREVKAEPIIAYYKDLSKALDESRRVLVPGGLAIYVIGKESVFYKFDTREVLYRVRCDDIFQELAERAGFEIDEKVDVELDKKNSNARPRSLDSYYETVFVLRKPE